MQRRIRFRGSEWIAGAALAGLGMFFLYKDLAGAAVRLAQVAVANGSGSLGILPAAMLSAGVAGPGGLQALLQHLLLSSWPLALVTLGTGLLRISSPEAANRSRKKESAIVDRKPRRSTSK